MARLNFGAALAPLHSEEAVRAANLNTADHELSAWQRMFDRWWTPAPVAGESTYSMRTEAAAAHAIRVVVKFARRGLLQGRQAFLRHGHVLDDYFGAHLHLGIPVDLRVCGLYRAWSAVQQALFPSPTWRLPVCEWSKEQRRQAGTW